MDMIILYSVWIITAVLLVIFIKRKNSIKAQVSFLFMQIPSWLFGAWVVQKRLIEYPVGFLKIVYKSSFTFEFFVFPSVSAIFNVHFPKDRSWFFKSIYILIFPTIITIIEVILVKYTQLIKYLNWDWCWSFITITFTLLISYGYYLWFFKKIKKMYGNP
ncbi:CBO0543 family protein [Paenibacillus alginolyticus]|uniref:CBO0543 family protein n=1 Tax=Paenibacillus alginolyticus TaxID=59839 RepID=UPI0035E43E64